MRKTLLVTVALMLCGTFCLANLASAAGGAKTYRYAKRRDMSVSPTAWKAQKTELRRFETLIRRHVGNRPLTYMEGGFKVAKGTRSSVKLDPLSRKLVVTMGASNKPVSAEALVKAIQSAKARFSFGERAVAKIPVPLGPPAKARSAISRWKLANPIGKEQIFLREIAAGVADSVAALAPKVAARIGRARQALSGVRSRLKGQRDVEGARAQLNQVVSSTTTEMPEGKARTDLRARAQRFLATATPRQLAQFRSVWDRFINSGANQKAAVAGGLVAATEGAIEQRIKGWVHLFPFQNHHNVQIQMRNLAETVANGVPGANDYRKHYPMQKGKRIFVTDVKFAIASGIFTDNVQVNVGSLLSRIDQRTVGRALTSAGLDHALSRMERRAPIAAVTNPR